MEKPYNRGDRIQTEEGVFEIGEQGTSSPGKLKRIRELIEEYATNPDDYDIHKVVAEIDSLYRFDTYKIMPEEEHSPEPSWHHLKNHILGVKVEPSLKTVSYFDGRETECYMDGKRISPAEFKKVIKPSKGG